MGLEAELAKMFAALDERGTCPDCGDILRGPSSFPNLRVCAFCGYCDGKTGKPAAEQIDYQQMARKQDFEAYLNKQSIFASRDCIHDTFENCMISVPALNEINTKAKRMADDIRIGRTIHVMISGKPGVGKTRTAMSIVNESAKQMKYSVKQRPLRVAFLDYPLYVETDMLAMSDNALRSDLAKKRKAFEQADILVIDDIGSERQSQSGYHKTLFNEIMRKREDKTTIVTTNVGWGNISDMYDAQALSRLKKHARGNILNFSDSIPDFRGN